MNHSCSRKALVIAVSKYLYWEALPIAKSAAECLAGELEKGGYIIDDRALLEGGTHSALREAVNKWLKEAPAAGTLLLYWTGHGHCDDGLYLIGHDTPVLNLTGLNAINAEDIGRAVAHSNAEKILVIIDTCYSGEGALDIAAAFARVMASRVRTPDHHKVVAVIASAHPLEKAREGVFCNALRSVMCDGPPDRLWSDESEFISSDYLAKALAIKLRHDDIYPQYKADGYGQDFIPNPRHQSGRVPEDVETRKWREDREHFYYASRGIEVEDRKSVV